MRLPQILKRIFFKKREPEDRAAPRKYKRDVPGEPAVDSEEILRRTVETREKAAKRSDGNDSRKSKE